MNRKIQLHISSWLLIFSLIIGSFLLFYKLSTLMMFIGDQGWFYLSARDAILKHSFPLVGIASSHPWLHQGPFWTYLLGIAFWLYRFNPLGGAYVSIFFTIVSIYLIYIVGTTYFSHTTGVIASLLYATSPLVIINGRMPYHTSPIPFFTLLFLFAVYQWIKGKIYYFPLCIFFLAILYNFELATSTLAIIFSLLCVFGITRKTVWIRGVINKKIIALSFIAFVIPMLPVLMYDVTHGFPQTIKFAIWIGYHIIRVFGFPSIHADLPQASWLSVLNFGFSTYTRLLFSANAYIALILFLLVFARFFILFYTTLKRKTYHRGTILIGVVTVLLVLGYIAARTPSDAYFPDIVPCVILLTAYVFENIQKRFFTLSIVVITVIILSNCYTLLSNNYFVSISYANRLKVAQKIIVDADNHPYTITSHQTKFPSFTMNYQYLTWWLGKPISKSPTQLTFLVTEKHNTIYLSKQNSSLK